jgi:carbon-monoxide dehydrogenase small subunit
MIEGMDKTLRPVILKVNNQQRVVNIKSNQSLLDVLRNQLNIKSIKAACWTGDCGVCTVLLDGIPVKSCLILALEAVNHDIMTVEGISDGEKINQLQEAFIKNGAVQCGFCTGAFLLMGHYIISRKQKFTFSEIQHLINGIICRCTGYKEIVQSIYEVNEQQFS